MLFELGQTSGLLRRPPNLLEKHCPSPERRPLGAKENQSFTFANSLYNFAKTIIFLLTTVLPGCDVAPGGELVEFECDKEKKRGSAELCGCEEKRV